MSFYSYKNVDADVCPGRIQGESLRGLCERVCVQVKKVYDSCMQQEQLDNVTIQLGDVMPGGCEFVRPLTFVSCRSTTTHGNIRDLTIERLCERPNFARVRANVDIPIDVVFCDAAGHQGTGRAILTVRKDVILYVPDESIIPFSVESIVGAICVSGEYCGDLRFNVTICVTVILKIVAEVELLIPSYGFCQIPPCEEFAENVCDEFFGLPIFPPQLEDCDGNEINISPDNCVSCNNNLCNSTNSCNSCNPCKPNCGTCTVR
ncbi:hypothetical protein [Gehongia tenuis]|uniref:Uncharacterized protein n=1 Tax=Gehongia tenuis TaxID=2763655 RepID=A0A926HQ37_9FIRM|nr:hypothetical protein [Gehongia tenuis]MBC8530841.1 hypothetical protein [Gehongia tenuis]